MSLSQQRVQLAIGVTIFVGAWVLLSVFVLSLASRSSDSGSGVLAVTCARSADLIRDGVADYEDYKSFESACRAVGVELREGSR